MEILGAKSIEFLPRLLKIIIYDDLIMRARLLRELELFLGLSETLLDILLFISCPTTKTLFEDLQRRRLEEEESRIEIGLLDLLDTLRSEVSIVDDCTLSSISV